MKIAILGFGLQGKSAYRLLKDEGEITIHDRSVDMKVPEGVKSVLGKNYLRGLDKYDLIVRSPSVHPSEIIKENGPHIKIKVTSNTNLFFESCPSKNIIGVTGTKGKGTTSSLIAKMLEKSGKTVHLGGNIGTPPLDMLQHIEKGDWVVLELANFQLIDINHSPPTAVCLMVTAEHLDWHKDEAEYIEAKKQLFIHQTTDDTAIYYAKNNSSKLIAHTSRGKRIPYYATPGAIIENDDVVIDGQSVCSTDEIKLLGKHNWQNVCAAVTTVWQITKNIEAIRSAIVSFSGLEMRLEQIRELNGVNYINDSFGTTPETALVAIEAIEGPKFLILGGSDKGASFDELARAIDRSNVRQAILIGKTAPRIKKSLQRVGFTDYIDGPKDMKSIVKLARDNTKPGDAVLLSPGCASFDLFKNYQDRGRQFTQAVEEL